MLLLLLFLFLIAMKAETREVQILIIKFKKCCPDPVLFWNELKEDSRNQFRASPCREGCSLAESEKNLHK